MLLFPMPCLYIIICNYSKRFALKSIFLQVPLSELTKAEDYALLLQQHETKMEVTKSFSYIPQSISGSCYFRTGTLI